MKVTTSKVDDAAVTQSLVTERDESYIIPEQNVENLTEYNISRTLASANDLKKNLKAYTESLFVMCILLTATHPHFEQFYYYIKLWAYKHADEL